MARKKAEEPAVPSIKHELTRTLPTGSTLADVQQAISDFRAQGAPEQAILTAYSGLYADGNISVTVTWEVPNASR